ncbi:tol-pal system protein YbgF [Limimonas halophila]|uniref:Cell division coordinator CpoB n=1 Tax=Limimonas halophila TaxID=1082479 RepID=A0A1G7M007_9PROT|nr:tol-pal system protein YbgF [Limimonas halophila]SDF55105.1 tol-pal system protein YbgF [Limimonas halophila]
MPRSRRGTVGRCGLVLAAPVVLALLAPMPAGAQSDGNLQNLVQKIERLQREVQTLQRAVYKGEEPPEPEPSQSQANAGGQGGGMPSAAAAQLQSRVSSLTEQLQRLTGQIEETGFKLRKLSQRVDRLAKDVNFRLSRLEKQVSGGTAAGSVGGVQKPAVPVGGGAQTASASGQAGSASAAGGQQNGEGDTQTLGSVSQKTVDDLRSEQPSGPSNDASDVLPDKAPGKQYQHAFRLLQQADYGKAETALQAFVKAHPEHDLAGNAKYWLGETYYVRGNYKKAAATFAEGYKTYPEGNKAPDNLLKLGMSLAALERTEDACGIFRELMKRYPDAPANIRQRAKREQQKLDCPKA